MYQYPYLEQFYRDNYSKLLDWSSPLRPSKSCPKNGAAGVAKFVDFYKKTHALSFTEDEVLTILNAETVSDGDTIFHQNLRVMRELKFVLPPESGSKKYTFTEEFVAFVESNHSVDYYIIEKLMSIASVDDLTMYFNFLICVMREAALYGQVIQYRDAADKFTLDVPDAEKRKEHQKRVYSVYGFKGDEARTVPENYTPNISYFCHAVLRQLGILAKSDVRIDNMGTLVLTPLGEIILGKIDENLREGKGEKQKRNQPERQSTEQILFQFDDATKFVWECIKLFNKNKELKQLLSSDYRTNGGSMGNYIRINDCFVAQLGQIDIEGFESIYTDEEGYINNGFDARDIEKFAEAVNDVYKGEYQVVIEGDNYKLIKLQLPIDAKAEFTPYLTALRTKPFMLLAGISGTGKSRIAREIAKACWPEGSKQRTAHMPENYCIVSVKPNWHDSTELIGYVSRINGKEKYVYGDFLPFVVKAWMNPSVPHILCLDEMNLAPVEQYFAEYLSAIESRESNNGVITTDPILKPVFSRDAEGNAVVEQWYSDLIKSLLAKCPNETIYALTKQFEDNGITIPQNLFVIGTVNMDETTFSFSRKVLDRAMTLEMNKVDLEGGLAKDSLIGPRYIGGEIIGDKAKGADAYEANKALCDKVIEYLKKINDALENTPFKIAYRTRNEFLLYAVNRLAIDKKSEVWQTLDEMTSMKILSRIEGDEDRCKACLAKIDEILAEFLGEHFEESVSHKKIKEMQGKFKSGYTSYWT